MTTDRLFAAIRDAARLAQIVRDNGLMIVNGVVYGAAGHGVTVTFAAHTQALAELRDANAIIEVKDAEIARLRSRLAADDEGEFGPEILEAADR